MSSKNFANDNNNKIILKEKDFPQVEELQKAIQKTKRLKTEYNKHDRMKSRKSMAPVKQSSPLKLDSTPEKSKTIIEKKA